MTGPGAWRESAASVIFMAEPDCTGPERGLTMANEQELTAMLKPAAKAVGCELVGLEARRRGRAVLLRLYIDKPDGVDIGDCERVSRQASGVLDVEDPIAGNYTLEVSSPGLDRPLFSPEDYARFAGRQVRVQLHEAFEGRRILRGALVGLENEQVIVDEEQGRMEVPYERIRITRLIPDS